MCNDARTATQTRKTHCAGLNDAKAMAKAIRRVLGALPSRECDPSSLRRNALACTEANFGTRDACAAEHASSHDTVQVELREAERHLGIDEGLFDLLVYRSRGSSREERHPLLRLRLAVRGRPAEGIGEVKADA